MNLRFSARGSGPDAVVHLTVSDTLRFGHIVRRRGEALCRPNASLPNLEVLDRQVLGDRQCCRACVTVMARLRIVRPVVLPVSSGVIAGDLVRVLERERQAGRVRLRASSTADP